MNSDVATAAAGIVLVGLGATAVMDLWALAQKKLFTIPSLDYRLVGRWIGHFRNGRFAHDSIGKAEPVSAESLIGWSAHYAIGILFAALIVAFWGAGWLRQPTPGPALVVGIGSVVAPFFLMQPCFGIGIAAAKTAKPWLARFRSLVAHASFAVGLYLSALLFARLVAPGLLP